MNIIFTDAKAADKFVMSTVKDYKDILPRLHLSAIAVLVHLARHGQYDKDGRTDLLHRFYDGLSPAHQSAFRNWASEITGYRYMSVTQDNTEVKRRTGWLMAGGGQGATSFKVATENDMAKVNGVREMPGGEQAAYLGAPVASFKEMRERFISEEHISLLEKSPAFWANDPGAPGQAPAFRDENVLKALQNLLNRAKDTGGVSPGIVAALEMGLETANEEYLKAAKAAKAAAHQALTYRQAQDRKGPESDESIHGKDPALETMRKMQAERQPIEQAAKANPRQRVREARPAQRPAA